MKHFIYSISGLIFCFWVLNSCEQPGDSGGGWNDTVDAGGGSIIDAGIISFNSEDGLNPMAYWGFEEPNFKQDASKQYALAGGDKVRVLSTESHVGKYIRCTWGSSPLTVPITVNDAMTVSFLVQFPMYTGNRRNTLISLGKGSLVVQMLERALVFQTKVVTGGKVEMDQLKVKLDGGGRKSMGYYRDGKWHHIVVKYNGQTGEKAIWVDGQSPRGFSKTVKKRGKICGNAGGCNKQVFSINSKADPFIGNIDEVAVFNVLVPDALHYLHYQESIERQKHYTFNLPENVEVPAADELPKGVDLREYAKQHPSPNTSALGQLQQYPLPRYKANHGLFRLYNWMGVEYLGGRGQPGVSREKSARESAKIQEELGKHWHYMICFDNARMAANPAQMDKPGGVMYEWMEVAKRNPDIPVSVTTFWEGNVRNKTLSGNHYLRNRAGEFVNSGGRKLEPKGRKRVSPAAPSETYAEDGKIQKGYLTKIVNKLGRPIAMINENGEVDPHLYPDKTLQNDPTIVAHKKKSGIGRWNRYQAIQKTRLRKAYRDGFMKTIPQLKDTKFTWYTVDAGKRGMFDWKEARLATTPFGNQYYSTPGLYPQVPEKWWADRTPHRGWGYVALNRGKEIMAGGNLFSPYIAAGWNINPEVNIRPSQWLGMLKCLGTVGAEFYYVGFFNKAFDTGSGAKKIRAFPSSKNFVWQAAMPAYAQAVTSRYEDILRNGELLKNRSGDPIVSYAVPDPRMIVAVRKHKQKEIYVIAACIQAESNQQGNVEEESRTAVSVGGGHVRFPVRRQGSVYIYDRTNAASPVFYQLDAWHEAGHPVWWSSDFLFDGEVYDMGSGVSIGTEVPNGAAKGDYTTFTSYVKGSGGSAKVGYRFVPRANSQKDMAVWIRARSKDGKKTGAKAYLGRNQVGSLGCITSKNWDWYKVDGCSNSEVRVRNLTLGQEYMLELGFMNASLEIDAVRIVAE